jgi:hypothetical protein
VGFAIDASESESQRQQPNFSLAATQFTPRENQKTQIAHGIRTRSDEKRAANPSRISQLAAHLTQFALTRVHRGDGKREINHPKFKNPKD